MAREDSERLTYEVEVSQWPDGRYVMTMTITRAASTWVTEPVMLDATTPKAALTEAAAKAAARAKELNGEQD